MKIYQKNIPCCVCEKGFLAWNPEETIYVCTTCGVQQEALNTWKKSAEFKEDKRKRKIEKEREWVLNILGTEKKKKKLKKKEDPAEGEWADLIEKSQDYDPSS